MNPILNNFLKKLDAILISSRSNIIYLTTYPNFSETERECFLLITRSKQYLITDKRYSEAVTQVVKNFEIKDSGANKLLTAGRSSLLKNLRITNLGIEEYDLTVSEYSKLKKFVKTKSVDLRNLRIVKQKKEIENIQKACRLGDLAFEFIIKQLNPGVSEREIADKLETFINLKGADISFKPIIAFGKNSSIPHHMAGNSKLRKNQIVLLDFGVKVNNYCSDMSRTIFFGKAPNKFKKMYRTVLEAQTKAIEFIQSFYSSSERGESRSKLSISSNSQLFARDIDKIARNYIIKQGFSNMIHSLGHGVGIEVHEAPHISLKSKDKISSGMIFSIEPGIYIPGFGGVRIEDLVVVQDNKAQLISHSNREIIEL